MQAERKAERKRHKADGSVWEVARRRDPWGFQVRCVRAGRVERVGNEMGVDHEYWSGDNWAPAPSVDENTEGR